MAIAAVLSASLVPALGLAAPAASPLEQARPGDLEASRGLAAAMDGQYDRALVELTAAIAKAPNEGDFYGLRGEVYLQQKRYPQAIADLRKAIAIRPGYADYVSLGEALERNKQYQEAVAAFRAAIALEPGTPDAFEQLGVAQAQNNDVASALDSFTRAVAVSPLDPQLHFFQGQSYEVLKRRAEARAAYKRAIAIQSDHVLALIGLGRLEFGDGNLIASREALSAATKADPKNATAFGLLGDTLDDLRDFSGAKAAYQMAVRLDPRDADSWAGLVYVLNHLKEPTLAALAELRRLDAGYAKEVEDALKAP